MQSNSTDCNKFGIAYSYLLDNNFYKPELNEIFWRGKVMDDISKSMAESIISNELIQDISEDIIDNFSIDIPVVIRNIPIVKYTVSLYSLGSDIIKRFELKKQLLFLKILANGNVNEKELGKRKEAYHRNEKWFYKEVESVSLFISRSNDLNKSKIQAYLYISLINKKINYEHFVEYLQILDLMLVDDINELISIGSHTENKKYDSSRCFRLMSLGMLAGGITMYCGESEIDKFYLTPLARGFCNIVLENQQS